MAWTSPFAVSSMTRIRLVPAIVVLAGFARIPAAYCQASCELGMEHGNPEVCRIVLELHDRVERTGALDPETERSAVQRLAHIGPAATGTLIGVLDDYYPAVRDVAADALGEIGAPAVNDLDAALMDMQGGPVPREEAARALAKIKDSRSIAPLIQALNGIPDDQPSLAAADALVAIGGPAVPSLIAALNSTPPAEYRLGVAGPATVRWFLLRALGGIRDARAVDPLVSALDDPEPMNRSEAFDGLVDLGSQSATRLLGALRSTKGPHQQVVAAALLALNNQRLATSVVMASSQQGADLLNGAVSLLIKRGRPDSEVVLLWILKEFGNKDVALELLNCGNETLQAAATDWATAHGYQVATSLGGSDQWGQGW